MTQTFEFDNRRSYSDSESGSCKGTSFTVNSDNTNGDEDTYLYLTGLVTNKRGMYLDHTNDLIKISHKGNWEEVCTISGLWHTASTDLEFHFDRTNDPLGTTIDVLFGTDNTNNDEPGLRKDSLGRIFFRDNADTTWTRLASLGNVTYIHQIADVNLTAIATNQILNYDGNNWVNTYTILDEDSMTSNSATGIPTQQSVKAYVDAQIGSENTLLEMNDVVGVDYTSGAIIIGDGTDSFDQKAISGDATLASTGTLTVSKIGGDTVTLGGDFTTSGAYALTLTLTNTTSVTLPVSGTLVSSVTTGNGVSATNTAGALAFTLGVITPTSVNGLTLAAAAIGFTIAGGTTSKTLTLDADGTASNWNTAYTHSQDNTQAHSDYLLNSGDDSTSGTLTAAGFVGNVTGNCSGSSGSCTGNAATVTNGVYTTDTGTVTAKMLQNAAADLGAADITINLGNTNGAFVTNLTTDGTITATVGFSGALTGNVTGNCSGSSGSCTGNSATATLASTVTVDATTTDTSCFVALFESASGSLEPQTDATLTYDADTGILSATGFAGALTGNVTGDCSGTAATVTGATQASITSAANLATVGTIGTGIWQGTTIKANYLQQAAADLGDADITVDLSNSNAGNVTNLTIDGYYNSAIFTASEMVITDASKNLVSAAVATYPSLTELSYVKGLSSAVQTQLGNKAPSASPTFTGTVTLPKTVEIQDTSADHQYVLAVSELTADRTITLPLLTGTDTFVFQAHTQTLTNKAITPRVTSEVSSATPTINTDNSDGHSITALATAITSMTTNLSGTPVNFQKLIIRIKDDGTARAITWGASFEARGVDLPTTTVLSKVLTVGFLYDTVTSKWGCVASTQEA